jgi:hypothetical protein
MLLQMFDNDQSDRAENQCEKESSNNDEEEDRTFLGTREIGRAKRENLMIFASWIDHFDVQLIGVIRLETIDAYSFHVLIE